MNKEQSIAASVQHTATILAAQMRIASPPKRAFRKRDRTPGNRMRKERARMECVLIPIFGAVDLATIMSQPVLRDGARIYPAAVAGEHGEERIMKPGEIYEWNFPNGINNSGTVTKLPDPPK
jgi:hypothetical protein